MKLLPHLFGLLVSMNTAQSAPAEAGLTDTPWQLHTLRGDSVRPQATLRIRADGAVSGRGWCNAFGGRARINGQVIGFEGLMATMRACADARLMQLESDYLAALRDVARWRIEKSRLILSGKAGTNLLVFAPEGETIDGLPEDLPDGG